MTTAAQDPKTPKQAITTENKSLETTASEVKDANASVDHGTSLSDEVVRRGAGEQGETLAVKMLHHHQYKVDGELVDLVPGKTYDLPVRKAESLINAHRAVKADADGE